MIAALILLYEAFNAHHGLNLGSADEHLSDPALTPQQRAWLRSYCQLWELTEV